MTVMKSPAAQLLALLIPPWISYDVSAASSSIMEGGSRGSDSDGKYHPSTVHRRAIIAGEIANPKRFPYYVRLEFDGIFGCGGSLITDEFVLTAAHCASEMDTTTGTVVVGGHNYSAGVTRSVTGIFIHNAYDGLLSVANDIALLKIEPLPSNRNFTKIKYQSNRNFLKVNDSATVIGMGLTETGEEAEQLKQVELKILDEATCDETYLGGIHRKSMLCAGDSGEDSCQGDSGGPLIVLGETPEEDIQVGVVSWGEECASQEKPGVYADVAYLQSWIDSMICQNGDSPPEGCELKIDTSVGPFILNPKEDICRDFSGAFYADWWHQFRRCDWIRDFGRINLYCVETNEAWINCPLTCHSCTYEADDDIFFGEGNEELFVYGESSTPTAMIMVFLLSMTICCGLCCAVMIHFQCCKCCKWCPSKPPAEPTIIGPGYRARDPEGVWDERPGEVGGTTSSTLPPPLTPDETARPTMAPYVPYVH